jgi:hypothetical protein
MGPETGSRTFDKLDLILFPIVLLLRVSLLVFALARFTFKMAPQVYDYFFHQASPQGIHQEFTQSILFLLYLQMRLILLAIYWAHLILEIVLTFPYESWHGLVGIRARISSKSSLPVHL